jgi:hypothetical protein
MSYRLSFFEFPVTWSPIEIPKGFVIFRASSTDPINVNVPRWFGNKDVGMKYVKKNNGGSIFSCVLKEGTKLMDIRVLKYVALETMINAEINGLLDDNMRNKFYNFMIAFGLCAHIEQVNFINAKYVNKGDSSKYNGNYINKPNPLHNFGARISYGPVDDEAAEFMSILFGNLIDGYIIPNVKTPWHDSHFNHEICLFDPSKSLQETTSDRIYFKLPKIRLIDLLNKVYRYRHFNANVDDITTVEDDNDEINDNILMNVDPNYMNVDPNNAKVGGGLTVDFFSKYYHITDISNINEYYLEYDVENKYNLQCKLSENEFLKTFINDIFIKLTLILYQSFKIVTSSKNDDEIFRTIQYHYRPIHSQKGNTFFVLKPGVSKFNITNIIRHIKENNNVEINKQIKKYTLNELMGAIYGILVHGGMFTLIFRASIEIKDEDKDTYKHVFKLKEKFSQVIEGVRKLFSLDKTFNEKKFLNFIMEDDLIFPIDYEIKKNKTEEEKEVVYDIKKGNMRNIVMDMMVNNPTTHGFVSIVRKNLNNQDYIRTRRQKQINDSYTKTRKAPKCPKFYTDTEGDKSIKDTISIIMVDGDEWYEVAANGFFKNIMVDNKRFFKAGPSGSTFMWMNMIFGLLGVKSIPENYKLLLLCIISDFVPIYHTLSEVLMIYSIENPYIKEEDKYLISENPVLWLLKHFDITYNKNNIKTPEDVFIYLNDKIEGLFNEYIKNKNE